MRFRYFFIGCLLFPLSVDNLLAQQDPVDLIATDTLGYVGRVIEIDISVNRFTDIISAQASINWDPALLSYVGISNFGITDLDENDFGTTASGQGHIRFAWSPDDAQSVTLSDGSVLFTVTFEIISDDQDWAAIGFVDNFSTPGFPIEFANSSYEVLDVNTRIGYVRLYTDANELAEFATFNNTSCDERSPNGILHATGGVMDTTAYHYYWYEGDVIKENPDYVGPTQIEMRGGDYSLRIVRKDNGEIYIDKAMVKLLDIPAGTPDAITEIFNAAQTSCSTDADNFTGAIEIEVNSEQPDATYNISWWKGDSNSGEELTSFTNLFQADKLEAGAYEVVIENPATTCKSYFETTISEELVTFSLTLTSTENQNCGETGNGSTTVEVADASRLDLRYYWFIENDAIDTTQALAKTSIYENIVGGNYKSYVIDLNSKCDEEGIVAVEDNAVIPTPEISQSNDTLYANFDNANWLKDDAPLNIEAPYLVPEQAGWYSIKVTNEYQCTDTSELYNYNITGLHESIGGISIYPNPFTQYVRISNPDENIDNIFVYDAKGLLLQEIYDVKQKFIDLYINGSSDGFYLIKIQAGEKILERKVFKNFTK